MGLSVGCGVVDVNENADVSEYAGLSGGGGDGLGGGGTRWWVCYRFPRVCGKLWEDLPNILLFFFNFCRNVFLVSLERRSGECG